MTLTSAPLLLTAALLLGSGPSEGDSNTRQTPVLSPTQPQPGEPAIAPAQIDAERAGPEAMPAQPDDPALQPQPQTPPEGSDQAEPEQGPAEQPAELPSWQASPSPPSDAAPAPAPVADWTAPVAPDATPVERPPVKGMALFGPAIGVFGMMVVTQLGTGLGCEDVYCETRGWPWRFFGLTTMGLAGGGGWLQGNYVAWQRARDGKPVKNPIGRRVAGWTMFILGLGGMITDTTLYQLCYDGQRGPYIEIEGFRYTCSPTISVVTLDLSTLVGATGLGLALSAESQLRNRPKLELSVAPWAGRGQAGLTVGGRF